MVDLRCRSETMAIAGREDRALLRSNPSARADAGTWAGAGLLERPLPSLSTCSGRQGDKPRGPGGRAPRSLIDLTQVTIVKISEAKE